MAVHLDTSGFPSAKSSTLHLLPCSIEHNGPTNVKSFFTSSIRETDSGLSSTFRGRELRGQTVNIPEGFTGIVMHETNKPFTEDQDRSFNVTSKFQDLTYWNLQTPTSEQDKIVQAMQWAKLSSVIHSPASTQEENNMPSSVEFSR